MTCRPFWVWFVRTEQRIVINPFTVKSNSACNILLTLRLTPGHHISLKWYNVEMFPSFFVPNLNGIPMWFAPSRPKYPIKKREYKFTCVSYDGSSKNKLERVQILTFMSQLCSNMRISIIRKLSLFSLFLNLFGLEHRGRNCAPKEPRRTFIFLQTGNNLTPGEQVQSVLPLSKPSVLHSGRLFPLTTTGRCLPFTANVTHCKLDISLGRARTLTAPQPASPPIFTNMLLAEPGVVWSN